MTHRKSSSVSTVSFKSSMRKTPHSFRCCIRAYAPGMTETCLFPSVRMMMPKLSGLMRIRGLMRYRISSGGTAERAGIAGSCSVYGPDRIFIGLLTCMRHDPGQTKRAFCRFCILPADRSCPSGRTSRPPVFFRPSAGCFRGISDHADRPNVDFVGIRHSEKVNKIINDRY